jgi:hypothetical protein
MHCFTFRTRYFHLHGDVTIADEGLQILGSGSLSREGVFIVPHLLLHGASVFSVSSEGLPHSVTYYDTHEDAEKLF